jgi:hypothetical protein
MDASVDNFGIFCRIKSNGITEKCNEACATSCGYASINETIGKSPFDSPNVKREYNSACIENNREIIESNRLRFIEEEAYRFDGSGFQTLSINHRGMMTIIKPREYLDAPSLSVNNHLLNHFKP